jgi:hypothetical protein
MSGRQLFYFVNWGIGMYMAYKLGACFTIWHLWSRRERVGLILFSLFCFAWLAWCAYQVLMGG